MKSPGIPRSAKAVLLIAGLWLASTWLLIVAVDFLNIFELQNWTLKRGWTLPFFWWEIYREARFTENLQWVALGSAGLMGLQVYREMGHRSELTLAHAWLILSVTLCLMLIEDSLNFRHVMADLYLPGAFGTEKLDTLQRMAWETFFYLILALGMVSPILLMLRKSVLLPFTKDGLLLFVAYGVYGLVGFGSALRKLGDWQNALGTWLIEYFDLAALPAWSAALVKMSRSRENNPSYDHTLGFLLVDHLMEESVELIAAALLLATVITLRARTLAKTGTVNRGSLE